MTSEEQIALLQSNNEQLLVVAGAIAEGRSLDSMAHIRRVMLFTAFLAKQVQTLYPEYGLDDHMVEIISRASSMHDIGKIAVPDEILFKPARLTKEEFDTMKTHTTKGCEMLETVKGAWDDDFKRISYEICRNHHEKYDGKGYPDALEGDNIPIAAQIVSVADVYDALVCERCYKDAFTKEQAFRMIISGECGAFNPKLMECFRKAQRDFEALADASRRKEMEEAAKQQ